jgi:ATP-binding cassette, subfamily G (WHITE), member 2, PDR
MFDKVTLLYEGRQIFFGPCAEATAFFARLGFEPAPRQTTADFLTSLTSPAEREHLVKPGFEGMTPRSAEEFATAWEESHEYARLMRDIDAYGTKYPLGGQSIIEFAKSRRAQQAKHQYVHLPFI